MNITFLGLNTFKIQSKTAVLITDPFGKESGLKPVRAKADIVMVSKRDPLHNYTSGIQGSPFIVDKPGEYEVKGVFIQGLIPRNSESEKGSRNIMYLIKMDGIRLLHLGDLEASLSSEDREKLNGVDVLMIPVGEKGTISVGKAIEVINQIEPEIVIPMRYKLPHLKEKLSPLSKFCEEMGISEKNKLDKLSISKKKLPREDEETKIFILKNV